MTQDPYNVLGIPSTATDEEVKQAYRRLAKRYHPDANPGDKTAEKKMQEINAAYDEILNRRANPGSSSYGSSGYGGGYGSGYGGGSSGWGSYSSWGNGWGSAWGSGGQRSGSSSGTDYYTAALNYLRFGRYREAQTVLNNITNRDAEWYYLSARACAGLGNRVQALQYAETAVRMEPDNAEYEDLLRRLKQPGNTYSTYSRNFSFPQGNVLCVPCLGTILLNMLCSCCCRY